MATTQTETQARSVARRVVDLRGAGNWVFLIPTLVFFVGYQAYPILRVLWISFTDYKYLRPEPASWVGLENYRNALADPLMYSGLLRAAEFTVMFLPGTILLPLLAVLIDRVTHPRLAAFYRIILLIPAVIPGAMIFVLWKWMYNAGGAGLGAGRDGAVGLAADRSCVCDGGGAGYFDLCAAAAAVSQGLDRRGREALII